IKTHNVEPTTASLCKIGLIRRLDMRYNWTQPMEGRDSTDYATATDKHSVFREGRKSLRIPTRDSHDGLTIYATRTSDTSGLNI
ncbi:hypothetical protein L9F63_016763, partial [Diploptera punctata]